MLPLPHPGCICFVSPYWVIFQNPRLLAVLLDAFFSVIFKFFCLLASYISISNKELVAVVFVEKMQQGWKSVQPWSWVPSAPPQQSVPSALS